MAQWRREGQAVTAAGRRFLPLIAYMGGPFGVQAFDLAAEVAFDHERFDETAHGGRLGLLVDRHINPHTELPRGIFVTRETPAEDERREGPYLSLAVRPVRSDVDPPGGELHDPLRSEGPHAREWDFLAEHAERALDAAGLNSGAEDCEKVHAFAEYAMRYKVSPTYGSFHPVDVLLHSSYCTGAANVCAALCHVSGILTRHCCISNHTMTEAFVGGRWQFVDNHADGARFVPGADYVDVTLWPDRQADFSEAQRGYLSHRRAWARSPWHYSGMLRWHWAWGDGKGRGVRTSLMDGYGVSVPCDPHHASALYPERESYPIPTWQTTPRLKLTEKGAWLRVNLRLRPGESLLKTYYAGPADDNPVAAAHVDWWFAEMLAFEDVVMNLDDARQIAPSDALPASGGVTRLRFVLPPQLASEPGLHRLVLTNRSGETLAPVAYPTPLVTPPAVATEGALAVHPQSLAREPTIV